MHFNLFRRNHTPLYNPPPGPPPPQVYAPPPGPPPFMPPHGPPPTMAVTDLSPPEYSNSDRADDEYGALSDAEVGDFDAAELFCGEIYPVYRAKGLADYPFDLITQQGPKMWKMTPPESLGYDILRNYSTIERPEWAEVGSINRGINIETKDDCPCFCLLSNLPVVGGALPTGGNRGVYYEISNIIMGGDPGYSIAVGKYKFPYKVANTLDNIDQAWPANHTPAGGSPVGTGLAQRCTWMTIIHFTNLPRVDHPFQKDTIFQAQVFVRRSQTRLDAVSISKIVLCSLHTTGHGSMHHTGSFIPPPSPAIIALSERMLYKADTMFLPL